MLPSPSRSSTVLQEPVSQMHLVFDEEDDDEGERGTGEDLQTLRDTKASSSRGPAGNPAPQDSGWDAGGDLRVVMRQMNSGHIF